MAEGVAWKLLPLRAFPDDHELALDNDVVLWKIPRAIHDWLAGRADFVLAEDVRACFGKFAALCGPRLLNTGIRGVPPGFSLGEALARVLASQPCALTSELDEQGLQCAALLGSGTCAVVALDEVMIAAGERIARAAGRACTELEVEPHNAEARRLYERLGYRWVRRELARDALTGAPLAFELDVLRRAIA